MARDPRRLRRQANSANNLTKRRPPDPTYTPRDCVGTAEAREILGVSEAMVIYFIEQGHLTTYQQAPGRSPHRFERAEVYALREWWNEQQAARRARRENAPPSKKRYILTSCKRVEVEQLSEFERYFGEWLTARQAAWMLHVGMPHVYRLRDQGRLPAQRQPTLVHGRMRWHFRKSDVLALMHDPLYNERRARFEHCCTPEGIERRKQERLERDIAEIAQLMRKRQGTSSALDRCGRQWE